jgi:hypothetical protein
MRFRGVIQDFYLARFDLRRALSAARYFSVPYYFN